MVHGYFFFIKKIYGLMGTLLKDGSGGYRLNWVRRIVMAD